MGELSWALKMLAHPKAAQEFGFALQAIKSIMTDPEASRHEKRETLNTIVNELSGSTFKLEPIAQQIMTIINMKEGVCQEYLDSEAQVDGILEWLPRMKEHQGLLLGEVKQHRKNCGLKV